MATDIKNLELLYFAFDEPVPYDIDDKKLLISPITLLDSNLFLQATSVLKIDKNSSSDIKVIQMSYLEYLARNILVDKTMNYLFSFILYKCIGISDWAIADDKDGRFYIIDKTHDVKITSPQFDDISRIILYQNIPNYDDAYVSPDVKKLIEETDKVKNGNIEPPTIERKISIISAHTGILKKDQLTMTLRAHQSLFEEVCGEVEFTTTRPIALYAGKANELGHWIYPKKKGKFDGYTVSMGQYKQSFGGDANISQGDGSSNAEKLVEQFYNN